MPSKFYILLRKKATALRPLVRRDSETRTLPNQDSERPKHQETNSLVGEGDEPLTDFYSQLKIPISGRPYSYTQGPYISLVP